MLCLYYCAVTAQCHSWICSVFSIAPVKRSSCVGKEERILPLNRESAILMWQHLNQVWVQWAFSYKSWVYIFCNAAKSLLPKRRTWKLISFPLLPLLQGPVGVPGLWAQQCRRHPAPPQAPRLPALRTPLRRALALRCATWGTGSHLGYTLCKYKRKKCCSFSACTCLRIGVG